VVFLTNDHSEFEAVSAKLSERLRSKIELWDGGLREFITILRQAAHLYCMDSGPAHIASAIGIPATVFFGPAVSDYVSPIGECVEIISKPNVQCRPCNQIECTNQVNQYCMVGLAKRIKPIEHH
jgi:ADP-heptose:LPS heptosyltransferase